MERKRVDSHVERHLLTALITSREFLSQAVPVLDLDLIDAAHFRRVAGWCLEYFKEYSDAPRRNIEATYHSWVESQEDKSPEMEAIHDLLEDLSEEYDTADPVNVPYLMDRLQAFLSRKGLKRLQDNLDYALHSGKDEEAEQHILDYRPVEVTGGVGIDPLRDEEAWTRAFAAPAQPIIEFPGDAGKFLNAALTRDALIGIQGPEKRGKTWWCFEFVIRALRERRKVAFFQTGDLSENQALTRLGVYFDGKPSREDLCGDITVPYAIRKPEKTQDEDGDDEGEEKKDTTLPQADSKTKHIPYPITQKGCLKAIQRFMRGRGLSSRRSYFKVSTHPNSTINVMGISSILDRWEMTQGFIPDVIVIDYADILAPEDPRQQARDRVNDTWKALRRLSQQRHCLVISPTQADAQSYDARTQTMKNFSEDKRKMAHVTGMIGLNQTDAEKELNVMRLNWLVLRESPFNPNHCLWVGQCLKLGRAYLCATL